VIVSAAILAAGKSSRFDDGHKLLVEIDGVPMVRRTALTLAASPVSDITLIVPESDGPIAAAAGTGRWRVVANSNAHDGLSTSVHAAIRAIDPQSAGLMIVLADMPGLTTNLVADLLAAFRQNPDTIVFPVSPDGRQGHPVIWPRALFASLSKVTGDTGGRALVSSHRELCVPIICNDDGAFIDIDTRADIAAYRANDLPQEIS
jgi:molybdenum cofactor cytidylyltransferase